MLQVPDGCAVTVEWGERTVINGQADAARFTVRPYRPGMDVSVNPRIGIDPEIVEWSRSPFWTRVPFDERLKLMQVFVAGDIATYEYDCTGRGRKAELLTDGFRAESDARRGISAAHIRVRPEVDWKPAGPGTPSTRGRFEGLDFPRNGSGPTDASAQGPLRPER